MWLPYWRKRRLPITDPIRQTKTGSVASNSPKRGNAFTADTADAWSGVRAWPRTRPSAAGQTGGRSPDSRILSDTGGAAHAAAWGVVGVAVGGFAGGRGRVVLRDLPRLRGIGVIRALEAKGFDKHTRLFRLVDKAYDAMHTLHLELHYSACERGVWRREED